MNLFDDWRYHRPTQLLLSMVGLWPYLDRKTIVVIRTGVIFVYFSFTGAQRNKFSVATVKCSPYSHFRLLQGMQV
ncbi:hypothetical protein KM043_014018 [Ampulex compressa]|nr:hypothetical protein KM043_014018 [Ampulex compressa]